MDVKCEEIYLVNYCHSSCMPLKNIMWLPKEHPLSFVLQGSEYLDNWFDKGIVIRLPMEQIPAERISFTYGNSMAVLKKQGSFNMLTKEMLIQTMADYDGTLEEFIQEVNREYHYMEVQVWQDMN